MKKVKLTIVTDFYDAETVASIMEKSYVAQQGIFTLECGSISNLTKDEFEDVVSQSPPYYIDEDENFITDDEIIVEDISSLTLLDEGDYVIAYVGVVELGICCKFYDTEQDDREYVAINNEITYLDNEDINIKNNGLTYIK